MPVGLYLKLLVLVILAGGATVGAIMLAGPWAMALAGLVLPLAGLMVRQR